MAEEQPSIRLRARPSGSERLHTRCVVWRKEWPIDRRHHTDHREPGELRDME